jgi:hypothetical protein
VKIEFDFDADEGEITPIEGIAVLNCFVEGHEDTALLYGHFGTPSTLTVIGMHTVGLDEAQAQFRDGEIYGEE